MKSSAAFFSLILILATASTVLAAKNPELAEVKKIECALQTKRGDHQTLTPNFGDEDHLFMVGYYTVGGGGRFDRKRIVYDVRTERASDGADHIRIENFNLQFQDDRTYDLMTKDYRKGTLSRVVCQPGIGGYGLPGGIPQATCVDLVYDCDFYR